MTSTTASDEDAQFLFQEWDRRARARDVPVLLEQYSGEAALETRLATRPSGVLRGSAELHRFFDEGGRRPNERV
ncbi:MAG: hypothetical protein GEU97_07000 [Actinophytocola sp.]|nr:hypothetical protein [Actinophytocola sp.]